MTKTIPSAHGHKPAEKSSQPTTTNLPRMRIRELLSTLHLGNFPPGPLNSITDIPGILISTLELSSPDKTINTGLTCIIPRPDWMHRASYASTFSFNGTGELTGSHQISETGLLSTPIALTGTFGVGAAHQGVLEFGVGLEGKGFMALPVVGETYDGFLHDCASFALTPQHGVDGLKAARGGKVEEGNSGGGRGMICHGLKGGTGSSSRCIKLPGRKDTFTIAALVQANYGVLEELRIGGVPVGRVLAADAEKDEERKKAKEELEREKQRKEGSIIVVIATDTPLHPLQLQRIAKRATVGLARVGGVGYNMSGDIFLAFSTANGVAVGMARPDDGEEKSAVLGIDVLEDAAMSWLFDGTADVVEEAIYNALCMAETLEGRDGHKVEALPLERVREIMEQYRRREE